MRFYFFICSVLLSSLFVPFSAHATSLSLNTYTLSQTTIYPSASDSSFATTTTISFSFSEKSKVSLKIVDAAGTTVKTLYTSSGVTNPDPKGWDGTNSSGAKVGLGTYTVFLAATSTVTEATLVDTSKTIVVAAPKEEVPPSQGISFAIPLAAGWNLISIPVAPTNSSPDAVLGSTADSIDAVWSYDPSNPLADSSGWLVYDPKHKEASNLTSLSSGYGYFMHTAAAVSFSGSGSLFPVGVTPPERELTKGWNLIGKFGTETQSIESTFSSIGSAGSAYMALWKLNPNTHDFEKPGETRMGDGFWIYLDAPHSYVPTNL